MDPSGIMEGGWSAGLWVWGLGMVPKGWGFKGGELKGFGVWGLVRRVWLGSMLLGASRTAWSFGVQVFGFRGLGFKV